MRKPCDPSMAQVGSTEGEPETCIYTLVPFATSFPGDPGLVEPEPPAWEG